ncbi:hypothetical protein C2S53_016321 [Perilla frutescens var. hirtella]|uniref:Uncharacterized protein n=1 Tax=Perilla frutescens var. hirtella TaxID=608512 RepID=A0AAD4NYX6_PERFH|nr:hypothetical protein C2S53_016321 [Perilla frutescens var. hirtella]
MCCKECDGFGHIQGECVNTLKKNKISYEASSSDEDSKENETDQENDGFALVAHQITSKGVQIDGPLTGDPTDEDIIVSNGEMHKKLFMVVKLIENINACVNILTKEKDQLAEKAYELGLHEHPTIGARKFTKEEKCKHIHVEGVPAKDTPQANDREVGTSGVKATTEVPLEFVGLAGDDGELQLAPDVIFLPLLFYGGCSTNIVVKPLEVVVKIAREVQDTEEDIRDLPLEVPHAEMVVHSPELMAQDVPIPVNPAAVDPTRIGFAVSQYASADEEMKNAKSGPQPRPDDGPSNQVA